MDWFGEWPGNGIEPAWSEGLTDVFVVAQFAAFLGIVLLLVMTRSSGRRRGFWCALAQREVEVEFSERGLPGFRRAVGVKRCSAFDPPEAIECRRQCLDASFREQWQPAMPPRARWKR